MESPRRHPLRAVRHLTLALGCCLLASWSAGSNTFAAQPPPSSPAALDPRFSVGAPLTAALLALQERGLKLVFSSRVVPPELQVLAAPVATELRSLLDELLAPHGLAVEEQEGGSLVVVFTGKSSSLSALRGQVRSRRALTPVAGAGVRVVETGIEVQTDREGRYEIQGVAPGTWTIEARRPGFVVEERPAVELAPGATSELSFLLQPAPLAAEETPAHPSRISLLAEQPASPFALSRDEILALPHLGGDVFRALSLLPGPTANDVSAQFHIRRGRRDAGPVLL